MADENAPDAKTFDFDAYLEGQSTFPKFEHTVYLDQASGVLLAQAAEEYEVLAEKGRKILRRQSAMAESSSFSLVDEEAERLAMELEDIESRTNPLARRIQGLEEKVKASGLTLVFQVPTAQDLGKVHRAAQKESQKELGKGKDMDVERAEFILLAQLTSFCVGIILPDGTRQDPPNRPGFAALLNKLVPSESMRLMVALNNALDASADWAKKLDAGFLGRGTNGEGQSVGSVRPEDRTLLGNSTFDSSYRGED